MQSIRDLIPLGQGTGESGQGPAQNALPVCCPIFKGRHAVIVAKALQGRKGRAVGAERP